MFGFGMPELIIVLGIVLVIFVIIVVGKKASGTVNIIIGCGAILFAITCFKDVPFIGTVFVLPGENILNAKMANPSIKILIILAGTALSAFGIFSLVKQGSIATGPAKEASTVNNYTSSAVNLNSIKEAKELLDSGAITEEEFNKIKSKYI